MKACLLILTLLFVFFNLSASTIVVYRTAKEIYIGADSKRIKGSQTGYMGTNFETGYCKIRQAGRYYYAFTGYNDALQRECAETSSMSAKNFDDYVRIFSDRLKKAYVDNLTQVRRNHPDNYYRYHSSKPHFAEIPVFCFEKGVPKLVILKLKNTTIGSGNINVVIVPTINPEFTVLGYKDETVNIYPNYESLNSDIKKIGPVEVIKKIINYEIKMNPALVGGPIYVMRLDSKGNKWIDGKKPKC